MKISKIVCDGCSKEIEKDPIKIFAERVDRKTGDFTTKGSATLYAPDIDLCDECFGRIKSFIETMGEKAVAVAEQPQVLIVKEPTEKEIADMVEAIKKAPVTVQPAEPPTVEASNDSPSKIPTVQELILKGVPKKEVVKITGCKPSSYNQIKYTLKKKGLLPDDKQKSETEPEPEPMKTYKCSEVGHKCIYRSPRKHDGIHTCDYIIKEGHRRGCKPEECDKFVKE